VTVVMLPGAPRRIAQSSVRGEIVDGGETGK
jgi:hypothetical protein